MVSDKKIIEELSKIITPERYEKFNNVLETRQNYITVALENIYQPHNASAVLRTCDCFGVQDVHIIENSNSYELNPDVALGSNKWLNLHKYNENENNSLEAIKNLKEKGYRIVATSPHKNDVPLEDFDLSKGKAAFFFGTELTGLTDDVLDNADEYVYIPMHGFTESFNISVCAAIVLHHLSLKLRSSELDWKLQEEEKEKILLNWLRSSVKRSDIVEKNIRKGLESEVIY